MVMYECLHFDRKSLLDKLGVSVNGFETPRLMTSKIRGAVDTKLLMLFGFEYRGLIFKKWHVPERLFSREDIQRTLDENGLEIDLESFLMDSLEASPEYSKRRPSGSDKNTGTEFYNLRKKVDANGKEMFKFEFNYDMTDRTYCGQTIIPV